MPNSFKELYRTPLPDNPYWISGGVLPRQGIMLMGGPAKTKKSWLALDLAHTVSNGGKLWGLEDYVAPEITNVLYAEAEIGEYELQRRIKLRYDTLGYDPPDELFYISKERGLYLDTLSGLVQLSRHIEEAEAKVVIIDPVARMMQGDENDSRNVGAMFKGLDDLILDYKDLSFVIVHHMKKPQNSGDDYDPLSPYNFRGSSRFFDAPDSIATMQYQDAHGDEWGRVRMGWKMRQFSDAPVMTLAIEPGGIVKPAQSHSLQAGKSNRPAWLNK